VKTELYFYRNSVFILMLPADGLKLHP